MSTITKYSAPSRKKPSSVMKFLSSKGLLVGEMLDFGCGRGFDAEYYGMDKYDPNWGFASLPEKKYDTITCNWVLNLVEPAEQEMIIQQIKSLLKPTGIAYITVLRGFKENYNCYITRGYMQRMIYLDLESLKKASRYQTYVLKIS